MILSKIIITCITLIAIDGDTVKCDGVNMRLLGLGVPHTSGIDAPERAHRAGCANERDMAETATQRLTELINGDVRIESHGIDRYGRPLVNIYNESGEEIGQILLHEKLVKPWHAKGPRNNWCSK